MPTFSLKSVLGPGLGVVVGFAVFAAHAHLDGASHGEPVGRDYLAISGTPAQLAARSERLAGHVCEVIDLATECPVFAIAAKAAADLLALQGRYEHGQQALHRALLGPVADPGELQAVEGAQLTLLEHGGRRYLRFLGEAAASLSAEQKQRFAH